MISHIKEKDKRNEKEEIFRTIFEIDDPVEREIRTNEIYNDITKIKLYFTVFLASTAKDEVEQTKKIRNNNPEILYHYINILNSIKSLAEELKLTSSLELSNVFTYLLYNGYLSKNMKNIYDKNGLKSIIGLEFADIMDGKNVCRNRSDMLNDLLCISDYATVQMNCTRNIDNVILTTWDKVKKEDIDFRKKIFNLIIELIRRKFGSHVFNLIEEQGKLYIYDSTNKNVLHIDSMYQATAADDDTTYSLKPYYSYRYCTCESSKRVLDRLHREEKFPLLYNYGEIAFAKTITERRMLHNTALLNDFYSAIINDIISISKATDEIKIKQRKR